MLGAGVILWRAQFTCLELVLTVGCDFRWGWWPECLCMWSFYFLMAWWQSLKKTRWTLYPLSWAVLSNHIISILISYCYCNRSPQTSGSKQHKFIILEFWGATNLKWVSLDSNQGVGRATFFLGALWTIHFLAFSSVLRSPHSLARGPFLYLQSQQCRNFKSFSALTLVPSFSTYKDLRTFLIYNMSCKTWRHHWKLATLSN